MKNKLKCWGRKVMNTGGRITARVGGAIVKTAAVGTVAAGAVASMAQTAKAELTTDDLEAGITSSIASAEGLITAGFALTVLFLVARVIKRGAAKVG